MRKIYFLVLGLILWSGLITAQNNPPSFDLMATDTIKVTTGQNVILIANIDDGDTDKVQDIVFTAQSGDETSIIIDSVSYVAGNGVAFVYISEQGKTGNVTITIDAQDQENIDAGGSEVVQKTMDLVIEGFNNPGVHYWPTNTAHWQAMPYNQGISAKSGLKFILPETNAKDLCKEDFFWGKMWGYIMPPATGLYNFDVHDGEGAIFYLSTDATAANIPEKNNPTASYHISDISDRLGLEVPLEAGKMYYFEAYHKEIVISYDFKLQWSGPGVSSGFITSEYLTYEIDQFAPATPENFSILSAGTNIAAMSWDASSDNKELVGYNVYINGVKNNTSPITKTEYLATGLTAETKYSAIVRAVDIYGNQSEPSVIQNFTTYQNDAIAPSTPQNLMMETETGISMLLSWDAATDDETTVIGYNIYIDGSSEPINDGLLYTNSYWLKGLNPNKSYDISVSAVDAGLNESTASSEISLSTGSFCATCNEDGTKKGRFTATLNPVAKNIGNGLNSPMWLGSPAVLNAVKYPYFEFLGIENATTNDDLKAYNKSLKNANFAIESGDPYEGKYSAKISGSAGAIFNHTGGMRLEKGRTYQIIFANKKSPSYTGVIKVKYYNQWIKTHVEQDVVPTDEWKLDTVEFVAADNYLPALAYIEFKLSELGAIYLDNIMLIDKEDNTGGVFAKRAIDLINDYQPGAIRWGSIHHNDLSFEYCTGINPSATITIGDWCNHANELGAFINFQTGISNFPDHPTDWYNYPEETVNLFMEYIAGDTTTEGGKIRASEGYIDNFLDKSPGLMIEFGGEVWGGRTDNGTNHKSPFANGKEYGEWCRMMSRYIKESPYYDPEKVFTSYSGRWMDDPSGWNTDIFSGDTGEVDILSVSGYNGGNLAYDKDVPRFESELGYHTDLVDLMLTKVKRAHNLMWASMVKETGRVMPMYFYEADATNTSYSKTFGQAVNFIDYMGMTKEAGFNWDSKFSDFGGIWALIEDDLTPNPQYYTGKYFNQHCKGAILEGYMETNDVFLDFNGKATEHEPVGCHAYNNDTVYSFMLCSRDFTSDYALQLDLPDEITFNSNAKMFVLTSDAFNSNKTIIDTIDISNFADSIIVEVPRYSVVYIKATGSSSGINLADVPWNNLEYQKVESFTILKSNDITINGDYTDLEVEYYPQDALGSFIWEFTQEEGMNNKYGLNTGNSYLLVGGKTCSDNGNVLVKVTSVDNPELFDTVTVYVAGQGRNCQLSVDPVISESDVQVYPVPSNQYISIEVPADINQGLIEIYTIEGKKVESELITSNKALVNISDLESGVYILSITIDEKQINKRIIKE